MESRLYLLPEINEYFYNKCIWTIAFSDKPKQDISYLFESFSIDRTRFLKRIDSFLDVYSYALTDSEIKNISFLLNFLKNDSNKVFVDSINSKLNNKSFKFVDGFIALEFEQRYMVSVDFSFTDDEHKEYNFNKLKELFINDWDILITHSMKCDNRTFLLKIDKYVEKYFDYIGSINRIISDQPKILEDKFFSSRVKMVCERIDQKQKDEKMQKIYTMFKGKNKL